jgi:hypothetical protein
MDIEKLREEAQIANRALHEAEAKERDEENSALIGKCFKYHNAGGGCDKKWWLYARIIGVREGHLLALKFEERPNGSIEVEQKAWVMSYSFRKDGGYVPISNAELDRAWRHLTTSIANAHAPAG